MTKLKRALQKAANRSKEFRDVCQMEEIIANVKLNPRNPAGQQQAPYQSGNHILDEELHKDRSVIEHANTWVQEFFHC